ncbi:PilZ domain-containing protein [Lachnospiraceae bacterium XBB1006]|nr:PilZ domain-containing protein [Lachnospiraceae bacterium XBB1006]
MEERRKNKRLDLEVTVQIERLDVDDTTTVKYSKVDVCDISKTGIGFNSSQKLENNSYYDMKLQIWTKEIINAVIEIVRVKENPDGTFNYGAVFIGMTETDQLKIEIYQIFNEL